MSLWKMFWWLKKKKKKKSSHGCKNIEKRWMRNGTSAVANVQWDHQLNSVYSAGQTAVISVCPAGLLQKWINNSSDCIVFKHRGRDEPLLKPIRCFISTRGANVLMKQAPAQPRCSPGPCRSWRAGRARWDKNKLTRSFWWVWSRLWRGQPAELRLSWYSRQLCLWRLMLFEAGVHGDTEWGTHLLQGFGSVEVILCLMEPRKLHKS